MKRLQRTNVWRLIALGGLAGGTAEVLWVTIYALAGEVSAAEVARQVTASVWPAASAWTIAPVLGIAIHMILAVALATLCAPLLMRLSLRQAAPAALVFVSMIALMTVWAVNFFIVLPVLNPAFIQLMPYAATLASKMLFGLAMAAVIHRGAVRETARIR